MSATAFTPNASGSINTPSSPFTYSEQERQNHDGWAGWANVMLKIKPVGSEALAQYSLNVAPRMSSFTGTNMVALALSQLFDVHVHARYFTQGKDKCATLAMAATQMEATHPEMFTDIFRSTLHTGSSARVAMSTGLAMLFHSSVGVTDPGKLAITMILLCTSEKSKMQDRTKSTILAYLLAQDKDTIALRDAAEAGKSLMPRVITAPAVDDMPGYRRLNAGLEQPEPGQFITRNELFYDHLLELWNIVSAALSYAPLTGNEHEVVLKEYLISMAPDGSRHGLLQRSKESVPDYVSRHAVAETTMIAALNDLRSSHMIPRDDVKALNLLSGARMDLRQKVESMRGQMTFSQRHVNRMDSVHLVAESLLAAESALADSLHVFSLADDIAQKAGKTLSASQDIGQ